MKVGSGAAAAAAVWREWGNDEREGAGLLPLPHSLYAFQPINAPLIAYNPFIYRWLLYRVDRHQRILCPI